MSYRQLVMAKTYIPVRIYVRIYLWIVDIRNTVCPVGGQGGSRAKDFSTGESEDAITRGDADETHQVRVPRMRLHRKDHRPRSVVSDVWRWRIHPYDAAAKETAKFSELGGKFANTPANFFGSAMM